MKLNLLFTVLLHSQGAIFWLQRATDFKEKALKNFQHTTCSAANSKQTQCATIAGEHRGEFRSQRTRCFPQGLAKTELRESKYWMNIHQVDGNTTPNQ